MLGCMYRRLTQLLLMCSLVYRRGGVASLESAKVLDSCAPQVASHYLGADVQSCPAPLQILVRIWTIAWCTLSQQLLKPSISRRTVVFIAEGLFLMLLPLSVTATLQ